MAGNYKQSTSLSMATCKICKQPFDQHNTLQKVCSIVCAIQLAQEKQLKAYKKQTSKLRKDFLANDRPHHTKAAQTAFNKYIRARDYGLPCISSGRTTGQFHAGHYRSIGAHPELRFCEMNVNCQTSADNLWKSGNISGYRQGLIDKYGIEKVEWLEGPHKPKKYTIEELKDITARYKAKYKKLAQQ